AAMRALHAPIFFGLFVGGRALGGAGLLVAVLVVADAADVAVHPALALGRPVAVHFLVQAAKFQALLAALALFLVPAAVQGVGLAVAVFQLAGLAPFVLFRVGQPVAFQAGIHRGLLRSHGLAGEI